MEILYKVCRFFFLYKLGGGGGWGKREKVKIENEIDFCEFSVLKFSACFELILMLKYEMLIPIY